MFIERCTAFLLSATLLVEPYYVSAPATNSDNVQIKTPITAVEDITKEPEIVEPVIETLPPEKEEELVKLPLTDEEIDLIALVTMGEAEGEPIEGKRLVIDVILNRLDSERFADTVDGVIYAKNAFECMWNGRIDRCQVRDDIRQLVIDELLSRTNYEVLYFRTDHYHKFGTPVTKVGNHYFSTK